MGGPIVFQLEAAAEFGWAHNVYCRCCQYMCGPIIFRQLPMHMDGPIKHLLLPIMGGPIVFQIEAAAEFGWVYNVYYTCCQYLWMGP
jgi:hypothetical protein